MFSNHKWTNWSFVNHLRTTESFDDRFHLVNCLNHFWHLRIVRERQNSFGERSESLHPFANRSKIIELFYSFVNRSWTTESLNYQIPSVNRLINFDHLRIGLKRQNLFGERNESVHSFVNRSRTTELLDYSIPLMNELNNFDYFWIVRERLKD